MVRILPSMLAADWAHLADEMKRLDGGVDGYHLDIMDGHFVPNISFGPAMVKTLRPLTTKWFDVHLMLTYPHKFLESFIEAGANHLTFHYEAYHETSAVKKVIQLIKNKHIGVGLSIKPATPVDVLLPFLADLDLVLIMSVEPGFGGQAFLPQALEKINFLDGYKKQHQLTFEIEVDGGINQLTGAQCVAEGATILVAGSYLFKTPHLTEAIESLRGK